MSPPKSGERSSPDRIMSCVWLLVRDMAQNNCGTVRRLRIADIVHSSPSEGCISSRAQSMVRPSKRGGVPVFKRDIGKSACLSCCESNMAESSPTRPPSSRSSPRNNLPPRNVPVARTTAGDFMIEPSPRTKPATRVGANGTKCKAAASPSIMRTLGR